MKTVIITHDKHHISHNPPIVVKIPHREHQKIHGNIPIDTAISLKMREYDKLVQLSVMLKNWMRAYEREFGENPIDIGLMEVIDKKRGDTERDQVDNQR